METALATMDRLFADLGAVDLTVLPGEQLGEFSVALGRGIDRLSAFHAKVVHAVDERRVWAGSGARDVEDWLASRTGTSRGTASARRKLGEALDKSPRLDRAVRQGELSAEAATQLSDAVTNPPAGSDPSDVDELIDTVKGAGPRDVRAAADRWRETRAGETPEERTARRYAKRALSSRAAADGLVESTLVLPEWEHRQVMHAINHAAGAHCASDDRTHVQRLADGLVNLAKAYAAGTVSGGREKPTVLVTCTAETLAGVSDAPGWTGYGDRIPADVVRHLAENAIVRRILMADSVVIDLGAKVRFVSEDQFQALLVRDGGCRMPGCTIPAEWCEADHIIPHEHGGPTDLANLALWCTYHHHVKHRSDVTVLGDAHDLTLRLPDGRLIACPPKGRTTPAAA